MTIKTAARAVVDRYAYLFSRNDQTLTFVQMQNEVQTLQRELAIDGDRTDLATEINARRQGDSVAQLMAFRAMFWTLLTAYAVAVHSGSVASMAAARDALEMHLFGNITPLPENKPGKLMLLDKGN